MCWLLTIYSATQARFILFSYYNFDFSTGSQKKNLIKTKVRWYESSGNIWIAANLYFRSWEITSRCIVDIFHNIYKVDTGTLKELMIQKTLNLTISDAGKMIKLAVITWHHAHFLYQLYHFVLRSPNSLSLTHVLGRLIIKWWWLLVMFFSHFQLLEAYSIALAQQFFVFPQVLIGFFLYFTSSSHNKKMEALPWWASG